MPYKRRIRKYKRPYKKVVKKAPVRKRRRFPLYQKGPFPKVLHTQLVYQGNMVQDIATGVGNSFSYTQWRPNDLFDLDYTNNFGNKQPLFFDQLLGATGPYKRYLVNAWKTTLTVFNLSDKGLEVFVDTNTMNSFLDTDTLSEIANRRGVIKRVITGQANAKPMTTISWYRKLKSIVPDSRSAVGEWGGYFNSSPNNYISNTLACQSIDGISTHTVRVKINHVFYVTLFETDAIQS